MDFELAKATVELNQHMKESEEELKLYLISTINTETSAIVPFGGCGHTDTPLNPICDVEVPGRLVRM